MTNYLIIDNILYDLAPIVHSERRSSLDIKISLWNRIKFLFSGDMQFVVEYRTPLRKRQK